MAVEILIAVRVANRDDRFRAALAWRVSEKFSWKRGGDFTQQPRAAINQAGINLNKLRAGLDFFARRPGIHDSTGSDDRDCRSCGDLANEGGRFFPQRRAAQSALLISFGRNWRVIQSCVGRDDRGHLVVLTNGNYLVELVGREVRR